jgi:hypothetical protein
MRIKRREGINFKIINICRNLKLFHLEAGVSGPVCIILFSSDILCTRTIRGLAEVERYA